MIARTMLKAALLLGAATAASTLVVPAIAQTGPPEFSIEVSGWSGGAVGNNQTGEFSHCTIARDYANGLTLALLMSPRYELNIGLLNPAWDFVAEAEAEAAAAAAGEAPDDDDEEEPPVAEVRVDEAFSREFAVNKVGKDILMVTTGQNDQLIELLMRGNALFVTVDQGSYQFALSGTFNSITALRSCIDTARQLAAEARATAGAGAAGAPLNGPALVNLLRAAGLESASVAPQDAASSPLGLSFAWSLGGLTGGVHQSPRQSPQVEIDKFAELYIDQFESTCTDAFQQNEQPAEIVRELYALKSATMQCGDDASGTHVSLFIALDDSFYTAFFHQGPVANRAQVDEATNRIRQLISQQAGG